MRERLDDDLEREDLEQQGRKEGTETERTAEEPADEDGEVVAEKLRTRKEELLLKSATSWSTWELALSSAD